MWGSDDGEDFGDWPDYNFIDIGQPSSATMGIVGEFLFTAVLLMRGHTPQSAMRTADEITETILAKYVLHPEDGPALDPNKKP